MHMQLNDRNIHVDSYFYGRNGLKSERNLFFFLLYFMEIKKHVA